ncbi:MAG: hypothetical protein QNL04_02415 [SAR324 cluster bacterium]|nr:hypothetical protein [SAR324 cluster bacterium]
MKEKEELELFQELENHLQKSLDIIYELVGDKGLPDEDVKNYFNPFFQTIPGIRSYLKMRIKKMLG